MIWRPHMDHAYLPHAGWTQRHSDNLEIALPRFADAALPVDGAGVNVFGAYINMSASTPSAFTPHALHVHILATTFAVFGLAMTFEFEVATGAIGAEVLYGRVDDIAGVASNSVLDNYLFYGRSFPFLGPQIAAGTRVSIRFRSRSNDAFVTVAPSAYLVGYEGLAPESDDTYPLDTYLAGVPSTQTLSATTSPGLAVTVAAWPTYGAWVQVIASAPQDLLVYGWEASGVVGNLNNHSHYLQFGIGAAASEVPYAVLPFPGASSYTAGVHWLRRPLLVYAGERLAVRATGNTTLGADVITGMVLYALV